MKQRKRIISLAGLSLFLLCLATTWAYFFLKSNPKKRSDLVAVQVQRGELSQTVLSTGVVQPENRLEIKPPIPGRAEQVLVKEGERIQKGQILIWMSSTERAALLDAARAKGPEELQRWEELYRPAPILAPINGTIILRNIEPGQTFASSDSILVMSDRLTVQAQVDETDIAEIHPRQPAEIVLDAYSKVKIAAHVDKIAYDAKTVNNVTTYAVDVLPEQTPDFMRSGMTANVTFSIATRSGVLRLPVEAVQIRDGLSLVQISPKGAPSDKTQRPIQTGASDGKWVEIITGLQEGETVYYAPYKAANKQDVATANPTSPFSGRPPR